MPAPGIRILTTLKRMEGVSGHPLPMIGDNQQSTEDPHLMKPLHAIQTLVLLALFAALPSTAQTGGQQDFGDYVVHFNAINTDFLAPEVASEYGITRSRNRALVNISIMKKSLGIGTEPQQARVTGKSVNLRGQTRALEFREVLDGQAIYYLAELHIDEGETLDFLIEAVPDGGEPLSVRFRQQFFTR